MNTDYSILMKDVGQKKWKIRIQYHGYNYNCYACDYTNTNYYFYPFSSLTNNVKKRFQASTFNIFNHEIHENRRESPYRPGFGN